MLAFMIRANSLLSTVMDSSISHELYRDGDFFLLFVNALDDILYGRHGSFFKISFSALGTNPRWDSVELKMIAFLVDVKRRCPAFHYSPTIHALHPLFLFINN